MEVIGRVESGTETESNAGAVAEEVLVEKCSCIFYTSTIHGGYMPQYFPSVYSNYFYSS